MDVPTSVQDVALFEIVTNFGQDQLRNMKITESKMGNSPSPVEAPNPTNPRIECEDVGFRIRSTQPTDLQIGCLMGGTIHELPISLGVIHPIDRPHFANYATIRDPGL